MCFPGRKVKDAAAPVAWCGDESNSKTANSKVQETFDDFRFIVCVDATGTYEDLRGRAAAQQKSGVHGGARAGKGGEGGRLTPARLRRRGGRALSPLPARRRDRCSAGRAPRPWR